MNYVIDFFQLPDADKANFRIRDFMRLTGKEASVIREEMRDLMETESDVIYVDAGMVNDVDLSGMNEIIHTHYTLEKAGKRLVFVYRKNSVVEKWVETTGLETFMDTAILPAI